MICKVILQEFLFLKININLEIRKTGVAGVQMNTFYRSFSFLNFILHFECVPYQQTFSLSKHNCWPLQV